MRRLSNGNPRGNDRRSVPWRRPQRRGRRAKRARVMTERRRHDGGPSRERVFARGHGCRTCVRGCRTPSTAFCARRSLPTLLPPPARPSVRPPWVTYGKTRGARPRGRNRTRPPRRRRPATRAHRCRRPAPLPLPPHDGRGPRVLNTFSRADLATGGGTSLALAVGRATFILFFFLFVFHRYTRSRWPRSRDGFFFFFFNITHASASRNAKFQTDRAEETCVVNDGDNYCWDITTCSIDRKRVFAVLTRSVLYSCIRPVTPYSTISQRYIVFIIRLHTIIM